MVNVAAGIANSGGQASTDACLGLLFALSCRLKSKLGPCISNLISRDNRFCLVVSMAAITCGVQEDSSKNVLSFIQSILRDLHPRQFSVELWDGTRWPAESNVFPRFTWKINNPEALKSAIFSSNRQVALAEAYCRGDFDIEGDIEAVFSLADYLIEKRWGSTERLRLIGTVLRLPAQKSPRAPNYGVHLQGRLHSRKRDRQAIGYHYDVSNDFYALWLDQNMQYSCACFDRPDLDLEEAQQKKLESICRKLCLKPGERLLDIGCGWGGLIRYAARKCGVHALGITLSSAQLKWAQGRIREEGLDDRCEVRLLDYREVAGHEIFDKIVSVGMVEHVGEKNLAEYFHDVFGMLRPGGMFLNSGIARAGNRAVDSTPTFVDLYIFPDGELVPISELLERAEGAGFEIQDVENLREHYRFTLLHWLRRLESHAPSAKQLVGELKYRMWRLYLAGSAYYFEKSRLDLYHALLLKTA
jgi:cyclopropane-fatty-acyl-phospholipid synthase